MVGRAFCGRYCRALSNAIGLQENEIREMGMRGRELVLNNYASGLVAKQIMGVYKSLL